MGSHSETEKHVAIYKKVFGALVILTIVTVACSYLQVSFWLGIGIALAIASLKGSLVGAFFMHLAWEKKMIYALMLLTAFFFMVMMGIIVWHPHDLPTYR